jgi:hypothetical protein
MVASAVEPIREQPVLLIRCPAWTKASQDVTDSDAETFSLRSR